MSPRKHSKFVVVCEWGSAVVGFGLALVAITAVGTLLGTEPSAGNDALDPEAAALFITSALVLGPPLGFIVLAAIAPIPGAIVGRLVPARCDCGLIARRVSSAPRRYACALGHEETFVGTHWQVFTSVHARLDGRDATALDRDRAQPARGSLTVADRDCGSLSDPPAQGGLSAAEERSQS